MEATGIVSFVGKINMDRNAPEELEGRQRFVGGRYRQARLKVSAENTSALFPF